jgi:hypothetical protein
MKRYRFTFPSPLWGGVRGGGRRAQSRASSPEPFSATPLPTLPHKGGRNKQVLAYCQTLVLLSAALLLCASFGRAEVQKFVNQCGQKLCPYFQIALTPPDGWVLDAKATKDNKIQIIVPQGQTFATADPLIYVQVFYHSDKQQTLADFARTSNARWIAANAKSKIGEMPAVERVNGKPAFLRFSFENPGKAEQAFEVGAFGIDSDKDGNEYVLDVVMSGSSKEALDRSDAAYFALLKAH